LNVTDSQPHSAPSTACKGDGPFPVPPCGVGSSVVNVPNSPQSITAFMPPSVCAETSFLRMIGRSSSVWDTTRAAIA
jgi:hypothetical protein